jgi:predicted dehydrogenase
LSDVDHEGDDLAQAFERGGGEGVAVAEAGWSAGGEGNGHGRTVGQGPGRTVGGSSGRRLSRSERRPAGSDRAARRTHADGCEPPSAGILARMDRDERTATATDEREPRARIGIVGTGAIFPIYARGLAWYGDLPIVRVADVAVERAREQAAAHGIPAGGTVEELLADPDVDVVVNITPPTAHFPVTRDALAAGKHVYVEKPLAASSDLARENLAQAEAAGRALGAAPDTFLGTAGATARAAIDGGMIGTPFAATSFVRSSRVEAWHPNPAFFFAPGGGPVLDWGPYHVAALVNLLGPIAEVVGATTVPTPQITVTAPKRTVDAVDVTVPTTATAIMRTASGVLITALYSFDVWDTTLPHIEIYGTEGTLLLPDPNHHDRPVMVKRREDTPMERVPWEPAPWRELPPVIPPTRDDSPKQFRGHGVSDLVDSLAGAPLRASAQFALHVLEVLEAMERATLADGPQRIADGATRPEPVAQPTAAH